MMGPLLDCADLNHSGYLPSFLNGNFTNEMAAEAFAYSSHHWNNTPAYFHPQLKVFATLTNLEGFPYSISFNTD